MKKNLMNFSNAKVLNKSAQKEVNGGLRSFYCGCNGKPTGASCKLGSCHAGCPGVCISGTCVPY